MYTNSVREALVNRRIIIGSWIQIGHPAVAEIIGNAGYEWIGIDCEHTDIDVDIFTRLARSMCSTESIPFARVRENDTLAIRQVLDAGARGVIVPLVSTGEEAKKAVAASKFPPEGVRGFSFCRANNWGVDFDSYAKNANDNIAVVVMIESKMAVKNIEDILSVKGVDGVFIGPYDMSGSYGIPGQTDSGVVKDACSKVVEACKRHRKSSGLHIVKPTEENIRAAIQQGFTFIALGVDSVFLDKAAREPLVTARKLLK